MTIKRVLRRINEETNKPERYLGDDEFHSLAEIKESVCSNLSRHLQGNFLHTFRIVDTSEEISIMAHFYIKDGDERVKLDYDF